jgi:peptidoglycan lytic transglycosylase G
MRFLKLAVLLIVIVGCAAGAAAYVGLTRIHAPYKGFAGDEIFVDISAGLNPTAIGRELIAAGVVRDAATFRGALWLSGRARALQAGEYRFDRAMTPLEVIDRLARGDVYRRLVTFREGLTIPEMAVVYEQAGFGSGASFRQAAAEAGLIRDLDPQAQDLEGYLFPETYALPRETPAGGLVTQMVASFKKNFTPEMLAAVKAQGLSAREAVTLASLVEKETAVADERPIVAAVYLNRKRLGMPMQADPTVIYALQRAGRYDGNIRREDLQFDSPYNTYRYPGLPPGPIAAPGRASLEAVTKPAQVSYLYFVSKNDGSHVFAETLDEHNRNVRQWQVEFFRQQRQRTHP